MGAWRILRAENVDPAVATAGTLHHESARALATVGAGMRDWRDGAERAARRLLQDPTCVWRSSRTSAAWPSGSAIAGS